MKLLAKAKQPVKETEVLVSEQAHSLDISEKNNLELQAKELVMQEAVAVKNSLDTGQLSKLLIEVCKIR